MNKKEHDDFVEKIYQHNKEIIKELDKGLEKTMEKHADFYEKNSRFFVKTKSRYYDRMGNPITFGQQAALFENDSYKILKRDVIGNTLVSTVWLGLNHADFTSDHIQIFETMIFGDKDPFDLYQERYATEEEALIGHERAVEMAKKGEIPKED